MKLYTIDFQYIYKQAHSLYHSRQSAFYTIFVKCTFSVLFYCIPISRILHHFYTLFAENKSLLCIFFIFLHLLKAQKDRLVKIIEKHLSHNINFFISFSRKRSDTFSPKPRITKLKILKKIAYFLKILSKPKELIYASNSFLTSCISNLMV